MHPQYHRALKLRLAGKSYGEIAKTLDISKGSLSLWFKNLKLTRAAQKILEEKMRIARKHGLFENNRRRTQAILIENKKIKKAAANEIKPLSRYELLLVGATLYWGEGYKRETRGKGHGICFVNSDPDMIKLFISFLRDILQIPKEKLRVNIRIHPNISKKSAINFWAKVTRIPQKRFRITRQISRASQRKRPRNSLPYGTLKLDVSGHQNFFKIKGFIEGLIRQT